MRAKMRPAPVSEPLFFPLMPSMNVRVPQARNVRGLNPLRRDGGAHGNAVKAALMGYFWLTFRPNLGVPCSS